MMHEIVLNGYTAHNSNNRCLYFGTAESYGIEQINVTVGPGWEDMLIKAVFRPPSGDSVVVVLGDDGIIDVPPEATAVAAGEYNPGLIVFSGVSDGVQRISADIAYTVLGHAPVDGKDSEPTTSQWEQIAAQYQSKIDKQQGAENAGKFLAVGENGEVVLSEGVKPEQIAAAVDAYLDENPIEAGATEEEAAQIKQNKEDIESLQKDKLSASELDSAIDSALAQAKASGEFDGKDGDPFTYEDFTEEQLAALKGKDGDDYTLTEADKTEIAEQAAQLVKVPEVEIPDKLPNPHALTFTGAVTETYDGSAPMEIKIPEAKEYTLPVATETTLGGVKASAKTDDMTQPVGIGEDGFLFTAPGASGGRYTREKIAYIETTEEVSEIELTSYLDGTPIKESEGTLMVSVIVAPSESNDSNKEVQLGYKTPNYTGRRPMAYLKEMLYKQTYYTRADIFLNIGENLTLKPTSAKSFYYGNSANNINSVMTAPMFGIFKTDVQKETYDFTGAYISTPGVFGVGTNITIWRCG